MTDRELLADKKGRVELGKYLIMRLEPKIENRYLIFQKSDFTMKGASVKVAILSLSSQLAMKPIHTKKSAFTEPPFLLFLTFGFISSNFIL